MTPRTHFRVLLSVLALGVAGGCVSPDTLWVAAPPPVQGAVSVVWFVDWPGGLLAVAQAAPEAGEAAQFPALEWTDGPPDFFEVTAAFYDAGLVQLGLPEGRLAPTSEPRSCALNAPQRVFRTAVTDRATAGWTELEVLPVALQRFLTQGPSSCARPSRCRDFEFEVLPLPSTEGSTSLIELDAGRVLVAQEGGTFTVVRPTSLEPQPQLEGQPSLSMARRPDGVIFLGGRGGRITAGQLQDARRGTSTVTAGEGDIIALAAAPDGSGAVYAVESMRPPLRVAEHSFDGARWATLWSAPVENTELAQSAITWLAPADLLVVYGGRCLIRLEAREATCIEAVAGSPLGGAFVNTLARLPRGQDRFDYYVGGTDSVLYRASAADLGAWEAVGNAGFIGGISALYPLSDGLVLGGEAGAVQELYPDDGFCPPLPAAGSDAEVIGALGDTLVITGGAVSSGNPATVTYLRPLGD